ncbi:Pentatricopeptide repeat-containing protein At3g60050 [Linum perenne]
MNVVALLGTRHLVHRVSMRIVRVSRKFCDYGFDDSMDSAFQLIEEPLRGNFGVDSCEFETHSRVDTMHHWRNRGGGGGEWFDAERVIDVLRRDELGFDTKVALSELDIKVSWLLVREVLVGILRTVHFEANKARWAKLGYKFFVWSGNQPNYRHSTSSYNLMVKLLAECNEFMAMWRVVDEMTEKGLPTTARTFNILICTCGEAGLARRVVERFIRSKTFNYRPFKHSHNAILCALLGVRHYKLIDWVHRRMLCSGFHPDILTYNVVMCAKYRLGELGEVWRLVDEMVNYGFAPDFHTYNIILHVLGKANQPLAARNALNRMKDEGIEPCVLHYTTLIDGLSKAGNIEACESFLDEMMKDGCLPDVVCYTVMITGYVVAGEFNKAQAMFDEMIVRGQLPNVFTYNSMIRGYCMAEKYKEACSMFNEMEGKGCSPNFRVYRTLVSSLRDAGRLREARGVVKQMIRKGQYAHLATKIRGKKRS